MAANDVAMQSPAKSPMAVAHSPTLTRLSSNVKLPFHMPGAAQSASGIFVQTQGNSEIDFFAFDTRIGRKRHLTFGFRGYAANAYRKSFS